MKITPKKSLFTIFRPIPLCTTAHLRSIEQRYRHLPLMARAGKAAADFIMARFPDILAKENPTVVLCGPGNNGGDGLVVAYHLGAAGVNVYTIAPMIEKFSQDAQNALHTFLSGGATLDRTSSPFLPSVPKAPALIIDALFGIGLTRAPMTPFSEWIVWANTLRQTRHVPIVSLDIASGLESDTGFAHLPTISASATISFIAAKSGAFTLDGPDHSGEVHLATLDLPEEAWQETQGELLAETALTKLFPQILRRSCRNTHKGTFGTLGIIGGSESMTGAAIIAGRAAQGLGAGKVRVGFCADAPPSFDPVCPELMLTDADTLLTQSCDAWVVGCGLGIHRRAETTLEKITASKQPLLLDADALILLGRNAEIAKHIQERAAPTLLTPHPAEAARLLQCDTNTVQRDRVTAARMIAERYNAHTLLKGNGSIIASPDGRYAINTTGSPALSFGGSGDALSGMIGALLAQSVEASTALRFAVCLHGAAADAWEDRQQGRVGLTSAALLAQAQKIINKLAGNDQS
ncbi:MAG: NAD(P)H-hydrate dehydratase [Burkholderiales bacterium]|jgi:hydroxyethylthiazole kinase-like uncharacterized protein yjeF|nr:NAD(P)H-hydrate dehydratase [Burkholderiales bacterium]